jgi:predicted nucleic acid-binding protein
VRALSYVDASVLVSLFVRDTNARRAVDVLGGERERHVASTFGTAEFAAVVSRRLWTGELQPPAAADTLRVFDAWAADAIRIVDVAPLDHRLAATFVRRFGARLGAPDAPHLAVCHRLEPPLLTFDRRQAAAAAAVGIGCDSAGECP